MLHSGGSSRSRHRRSESPSADRTPASLWRREAAPRAPRGKGPSVHRTTCCPSREGVARPFRNSGTRAAPLGSRNNQGHDALATGSVKQRRDCTPSLLHFALSMRPWGDRDAPLSNGPLVFPFVHSQTSRSRKKQHSQLGRSMLRLAPQPQGVSPADRSASFRGCGRFTATPRFYQIFLAGEASLPPDLQPNVHKRLRAVGEAVVLVIRVSTAGAWTGACESSFIIASQRLIVVLLVSL